MSSGRLIAGLLAFVMLFNHASGALAFTGMTKVADIHDEGGTFVAWQASDLSTFRSSYTAPNGIVISVSAVKDHIAMGFGDKRLVAQRKQDGSVHIITFDGHQTSAQDLSTTVLQAAAGRQDKKEMADALDRAVLTALSKPEKEAYDAMLAFFLKHDEIASMNGIVGLSARCILNIAAFYVITAAAIVACIESVGLLCAGAIAGAYQSLDAAIAACDAEQQ